MGALIAIVAALAGGQAIGAVLGGLSIASWVSLGGVLVNATPEVINIAKTVHPAFHALATAIEGGAAPDKAAHAAINTFEEWAKANPGVQYYKPDGSSGVT